MKLRLKDLTKITGSSIDVTGVVEEVVGYKKLWFFNNIGFSGALKKALLIIKHGQNLDLEELEYNEKGNIKRPSNIDSISFKAMMEINSFLGSVDEDSDVVNMMSRMIAISCYEKNIDDHYDSDCKKFKDFIEKIENESLVDMVGLYNWIYKNLKESQLEWKKRFASVEVPNEDMQTAGIHRMQQFNMLSTIKKICKDFNSSYDEAWQVSYALTQMNSYSDATYAHIHENLRVIKERKMREQRRYAK